MTIVRQFILLAKVILPLFLSHALCQQVSADTSNNTNVSAQQVIPPIKQADCIDFINENTARVTCGFIDLPSNHDTPDTNQITIPVVIARQTRSLGSSAADAIGAILIPGGGGPGGSMGFGYLYNPGEYLEYFTSLRLAGFDIVIVDQRGAGLSDPILRCTETAKDFKNNIINDTPLRVAIDSYTEAVDQCQTRLANSNIQLADFDTYQSARDFISVMKSLPYDWWGTLATSYATAIAQTIEIIEPETFKRIVLDSPVPLDYQQPYTLESSISSISRILTLCEETRRCNKKHRNIKQKFKSVLTRARDKPFSVAVKVTDANPNRVERKKIIVNDTTLLDILVTAAYNNYYLAVIPKIIDDLNKNRTGSLVEITEEYWYGSTDLDYAEGLSWTVHCRERRQLEAEFLRSHPEKINRYSTESQLFMQQEKLICDMWNVGASTQLQIEKPFVPETLIIAGDLDPVIGSDDISNTANDFVNKKVTVLAGMGHSVWYQSACTRQHVTNFFAGNQHSAATPCNDGLSRFK